MHIVSGLLVGLVVGALVALVGSLLDPSTDNRYAKFAGFGVFVLVFLAYTGLFNA